MPRDPKAKVTPEEIVGSILDEMHESITPGWYTDFVPNIFRVYLYREDLERLVGLESRIREQAQRALDEELDKLNRPARALPFLPGTPQKRCEPLGHWTIELYENGDENAASNRLLVKAAAPTPPRESLEGPATLRVSAEQVREAGGTETARSPNAAVSAPDADAHARLVYEDDSGRHIYEMTKDLIKIGRGGALEWVDVKLLTRLDVSREHLQIRRDPKSGKFFLKDLSKLGTWMNGSQIPPSVTEENGEPLDRNVEVELPGKANLSLANVISIDFKKLR